LALDDKLYLIRAGGDDLVIRDASPVDRLLVELLSHDALTAAELSARMRVDDETLRAKLDALDAAGVLMPGASSAPLDQEDAERFSRQLPYLAEYGDERELQRRLMRARVAVLGCGGLGTWAMTALAAAGIRHFRLCDDDTVDLSNLNRQAIYRPDQIGRMKVDAAADWLRRFDPRLEVHTIPVHVDGVAAAARVVAEADAVVLTADHPPYRLGRWVNAACLAGRIPFIAAGQVPPVIRIGPLYVPGRTACFACHETALRTESIAYDRYVDHVQSAPVRTATLGPASAIVGSILAMELMHLLAGLEPATAGAALAVDVRTLRVRRHAVPRDRHCDACQLL
jgi:bacteriocin biosynthesis cyclodehydratase domain-containing protein